MPGFELFGTTQTSAPSTIVELPPSPSSSVSSFSYDAEETVTRSPGAYYNARLDPKNFLEGPLSLNPATRLRQMLARPGIVVRQSPQLFPMSTRISK